MANAKKIKCLSFVVPNKIGQLATVCELIAGQKANITTLSAREAGKTAEFILSTDALGKVKKALSSLEVEIKEVAALRVDMPNKPGRLLKVAKRLAEEGIDIHGMWADATTGKTGGCIMMTSDDLKAARLINKKVARKAGAKQ